MSCTIYTCKKCGNWGSGSDVFDKEKPTETCEKCGNEEFDVDWDEQYDTDDE